MFNEAEAKTTASALVATIGDDVIPAALDVAKSRAAAQDTTVGNVRTRATGVLSVAALVLTVSSGVGLIANDPSHGGVRLDTWTAWMTLGVIVLIGVLTSWVQRPQKWTFDSGTNIFEGQDQLPSAQREALCTLEVGVARNDYKIRRLFYLYIASMVLLAVEVIIVALDVGVLSQVLV